MFGIGSTELLLIALFGFLIFGPEKLPEIAKTVGAAISKFKNAQREVETVVHEEIIKPIQDVTPKNPFEELSKKNPFDITSKETFSERKANYDREKFERKKREAVTAATTHVRSNLSETAAKAKAQGVEPPTIAEQMSEARLQAKENVSRAEEERKQADDALVREILDLPPVEDGGHSKNENITPRASEEA
ncbi:MAG: twin-arginine translocase TatA/TatE family subunit [Eggerthellaceae bacterium]|nr:twin-arginine translocase TatA/TatE family subunit [Eggerthellaceae bacterium]